MLRTGELGSKAMIHPCNAIFDLRRFRCTRHDRKVSKMRTMESCNARSRQRSCYFAMTDPALQELKPRRSHYHLSLTRRVALNSVPSPVVSVTLYIQLCLPHNMVAQANKTSKNTIMFRSISCCRVYISTDFLHDAWAHDRFYTANSFHSSLAITGLRKI